MVYWIFVTEQSRERKQLECLLFGLLEVGPRNLRLESILISGLMDFDERE